MKILLSCKGRYVITDAAAALPVAGETLTGKAAVAYALELERLTAGAVANETQNNAPKGS